MSESTKSPLLTIIIVNLNSGSGLRDTVQMVLAQTFDDFEVIIKDGCSTDDSLTGIPADDRVSLFKEVDGGIYDAMNQALSYSSGKYVHFLNVGDRYPAINTLSLALSLIESDRKSSPIQLFDVKKMDTQRVIISKEVNHTNLLVKSFCHQGQIIKRVLFEKYGVYDLNYSYAADHEFLIRTVIGNSVPFQANSVVLIEYLGGGFSSSLHSFNQIQRELRAIRKKFAKGWLAIRAEIKAVLLAPRIRRAIRLWIIRSPAKIKEK